MKEHFKEQFELDNTTPLKKEQLKKLKGKSLYSDYQEGDIIVAFLEQSLGDIEPPYTEPQITLSLRMIVDREFNKLEKDFKFIRMSTIFPVLERKE